MNFSKNAKNFQNASLVIELFDFVVLNFKPDVVDGQRAGVADGGIFNRACESSSVDTSSSVNTNSVQSNVTSIWEPPESSRLSETYFE